MFSIRYKRSLWSAVCALPLLMIAPMRAQQADASAVIAGVDGAVRNRVDHLREYTVTEHYRVLRGGDTEHAAAEMTVREVSRKSDGKHYTVLSQSGSSLLLSTLKSSLENEQRLSQPGVRETILVTSANYEMRLNAPTPQMLEGRACWWLSITPRRDDPSLFKGTLWVDARDYAIVRLDGTAAKSKSMLASAAHVERQYAMMSGYPMAVRARATTHVALLGQATILIDYSDYQLQTSAQ